jgi:ABC-type nitrate/sulfonate/bicarbonate transport system substrate-binding protein
MLAAHRKSVAWFYDSKNRAEAVAILAEVSKIKTEDCEKSYDFLVKGKFFEPNGVISRTKLGALVKAMQQLGDLPADFDAATLVMPDIVKMAD